MSWRHHSDTHWTLALESGLELDLFLRGGRVHGLWVLRRTGVVLGPVRVGVA